jgi:hypothetical protein
MYIVENCTCLVCVERSSAVMIISAACMGEVELHSLCTHNDTIHRAMPSSEPSPFSPPPIRASHLCRLSHRAKSDVFSLTYFLSQFRLPALTSNSR